jgi:Flp pilus assembly protein TadD
MRNDGEAHLLAGVFFSRAGKTEKALDAFRKAVEIDPNEWRAYRHIGAIYEGKGLHEMAQRFAEQAEGTRLAATKKADRETKK